MSSIEEQAARAATRLAAAKARGQTYGVVHQHLGDGAKVTIDYGPSSPQNKCLIISVDGESILRLDNLQGSTLVIDGQEVAVPAWPTTAK